MHVCTVLFKNGKTGPVGIDNSEQVRPGINVRLIEHFERLTLMEAPPRIEHVPEYSVGLMKFRLEHQFLWVSEITTLLLSSMYEGYVYLWNDK